MKKFTQLTMALSTRKLDGGAEGDVRVARRIVVPFACHCSIGAVAEVQLHFCGMFKSCHAGPVLAIDKIVLEE